MKDKSAGLLLHNPEYCLLIPDSVLSILQMPSGVPVATVALNGAKNAGILAAQILGSSDKNILEKILAYKEGLKAKVIESSKNLK